MNKKSSNIHYLFVIFFLLSGLFQCAKKQDSKSVKPEDSGQTDGAVQSAFVPGTDRFLIFDEYPGDWNDWSWGSIVDFACKDPVYSGNYSLSVKVDEGWGALYIHNDRYLIDIGSFDYFSFYIHGGNEGRQVFQILLMDEMQKPWGVFVLSDYLKGNGIPPGQWIKVNIPLADAEEDSRRLKKIWFQSYSADPQSVIYLDKLEFYREAVNG